MRAGHPEAYEGIDGADLDPGNSLLSLDDAAVEARRLLVGVASALYSCVLVGQPAPVVAELSRRMHKPQPGDLVVETTRTLWLRAAELGGGQAEDDWYRGVGLLLARRVEWVDEDTFTDPPEPLFDDVTYVQYGPGHRDICRWHNASFIAIPTRRPGLDDAGWWPPPGPALAAKAPR
jgi:hypothetical protein